MVKLEFGDKKVDCRILDITKFADTPEDIEALRWFDWLKENIGKVSNEWFTELFNTFGDYGFCKTDEELKCGAYGHTLGELDQLIMEETCRRLKGRIRVIQPEE